MKISHKILSFCLKALFLVFVVEFCGIYFESVLQNDETMLIGVFLIAGLPLLALFVASKLLKLGNNGYYRLMGWDKNVIKQYRQDLRDADDEIK